MILNSTISRTRAFLDKPGTAAWVFLFPSISALLIFVFVPLIAAFGMSFFDINIFLNNIKFIGIDNFREIISDSRFWNSLVNTLYFTAGVVPAGTLLSLATALYVAKNTRYRKFLRLIFYAPVVCSMTAMGIVWAILMDPNIGIFAKWFDIFGIVNFTFLKHPDFAMPLVMLMSIWKTFGLSMIILTAAIQAIPDFYYEAALIDGAGKWKQFIYITIPQIMPVLGFCLITTTIQSLMVFDQTYIMTGGGPLFRTETIVQYIYSRAFSISPFRLGYASSIALVLFIIIFLVSLVMYRFFMKKEKGVSGEY